MGSLRQVVGASTNSKVHGASTHHINNISPFFFNIIHIQFKKTINVSPYLFLQ